MNFTSEEHARVIPWTPEWSKGAPDPRIFADGQSTYLIYHTDAGDGIMGMAEFLDTNSFRFGIVNDEAADGHPLYLKGLETYQAHIVERSNWIAELKRINSVHPRYSVDRWRDLKHYLLFFHDQILEVVAKSVRIEVFSGSKPDLIKKIAGLMNA